MLNYVFARLTVAILSLLESPVPDDQPARRLRGTRGQATTEYALVLLAAALVPLLVVAWAPAGGGAAKVARLFNKVIDSVIDKV